MKLTESEIAERVKTILIDEFEIEEAEIKPEANIYENLGLDSLDSVDLVVALEKAFQFKVVREQDEEKIRAIRLLRELYAFIIEKQEAIANANL